MLPQDWARTVDRPRTFALADGARALRQRYESLGGSEQLERVLVDLVAGGATHAVVEAPYVDFDYRAEYSQLYSRTFNPPPDKCERLLFFSETRFMGYSVMRPSHKPVGRTGVVPPPQAEPLACCLARDAVRPGGRRLEVEAYPFLSQDGQYGRCAHAAIWSVARYHHLRHRTPRHSPAAVVEAAGTRETVDRTFASGGLYLHQVVSAFHGLGLPTMVYDPDKYPHAGSNAANGPVETVQRVVCRYLNSGFPVALNTEAHLTVLTGYGHGADGIVFLRSDDNHGPYERVHEWQNGADRLGRWQALLVPLPARLHVPGEAAEIAARREMLRQAGATSASLGFRQLVHDGALRLRTYAIESAEYKRCLANRTPALPEAVIAHHLPVPMSSWVWVTEFQRKTISPYEPAEVVAELVIDATSHRLRPQPLVAHLPGRCIAWPPDEPVPRGKTVDAADASGSAMPARRAVG